MISTFELACICLADGYVDYKMIGRQMRFSNEEMQLVEAFWYNTKRLIPLTQRLKEILFYSSDEEAIQNFTEKKFEYSIQQDSISGQDKLYITAETLKILLITRAKKANLIKIDEIFFDIKSKMHDIMVLHAFKLELQQ